MKSKSMAFIPMTKKLYYTPEFSDFHVGFEYEIKEYCPFDKKDIPEVWTKQAWGALSDLMNVANFVSDSNGTRMTGVSDSIRVKYLDRSDFESIDFKFVSRNSMGWDKYTRTIKNYLLEVEVVHIEHLNLKGRMSMVSIHQDGASSTYIIGPTREALFPPLEIKNITELIKLLKQARLWK